MTLDELRDVMADAIKCERDTRPYPLADAAIAAMKAAGLVIGERATSQDGEQTYTLVRVIPNE